MFDLILISGKELRRAVRSIRFVLIVLIVIPLFLLATIVGCHKFLLSQDGYEYSLQQQSTSYRAVKTYQPLLGIRIAAYRAPNPKAILAAGILQPLGDTFFLYNINNPVRLQTLLVHNSFARLHGQWDLLAIIGVVLSFLALLISYDAMAGEKRDGTIRLLFSSSVRRTITTLGKVLGLTATMAIPILLAAVMSAILLFFFIPGWSSNILPEFIAIMGLAILYSGVFVTLGIVASCLCHRPFRALVVAIVFWIVLVFAVPQTITIVSAGLSPVPSIEENTPRYLEATNQYLAGFQQFPQDPIERRKAWFRLTKLYQDELYSIWLDTGNSVRSQERNAWSWGWLSPTLTLSLASTGLSGTNPAAEITTVDTVWSTKARFAEHLEERLIADMVKAGQGDGQLPRYENGIPWGDMPKVRFRDPPALERWSGFLLGSLIQIGWIAALLICAMLLTRRYDPR